jgi:hypothetical protein
VTESPGSPATEEPVFTLDQINKEALEALLNMQIEALHRYFLGELGYDENHPLVAMFLDHD